MSHSSQSNVVLDKIRCVYAIEYDPKTRKGTLKSDAPVFDVSQPLHLSMKGDGECTWFQTGTGQPMRRRDIRSVSKNPPPTDWVRTGEPDNNGHTIGFIPIRTDPSAKYMREALDYEREEAVILNSDGATTRKVAFADLAGKTAEFLGPKVQGNPSKLSVHCFYIHGEMVVPSETVPLHSFAALREHFLTEEREHGRMFEGYVIRLLATGQLFKITRSHLGLPWKGGALAFE